MRRPTLFTPASSSPGQPTRKGHCNITGDISPFDSLTPVGQFSKSETTPDFDARRKNAYFQMLGNFPIRHSLRYPTRLDRRVCRRNRPVASAIRFSAFREPVGVSPLPAHTGPLGTLQMRFLRISSDSPRESAPSTTGLRARSSHTESIPTRRIDWNSFTRLYASADCL
jgi:hypothetical protein